jgi:hypothetical protein
MNLEKLEIVSTSDTPSVVLDAVTGVFEIKGRSLPENAHTFYQPVKEWVSEYMKSPNPKTEFVFHLDYFNSSTIGKLVDILMLLEEIFESGKKVDVVWYYAKNDLVMEDRAEEIGSFVNLPVRLENF